MRAKIKKIALFIVVIAVIIFMVAGYLLSGVDFTAQPDPADFTGPTGEPFVNGPTEGPPGQ